MPEPRSDTWLLAALLTLGLGACTIANRQAEMLAPSDEPAAAGSGEVAGGAATPEAGAGNSGSLPAPARSNAADPGAGGTSGSAGTATAGSAGTPVPAPDAGVDTLDAGDPQPDADASSEDASQVDDVTCAFELSACLLLDPLNFEACIRMNMQRCKLLAADGGVPAPTSPACSMQTADCITKNPGKAQECLDMQAGCML